MSEAGECRVCDGGFNEAVDTLLYLGYDFSKIAKDLGQPSSFEDEVRKHVFALHTQDCTPERYQLMIVTYMRDAKKLFDRELRRPLNKQNNNRINSCMKAFQWSIDKVAAYEGFNKNFPAMKQGKAGNALLEALNVFAEMNPDAVKRIKEAARREKPALIAGPPVVPVKSPLQGEAPKIKQAEGPTETVETVGK